MSLSSLLEADKELTTYLRERFAKPRFGGKPAAEAPLPGLYELLRLPVYRESEMRGKAPADLVILPCFEDTPANPGLNLPRRIGQIAGRSSANSRPAGE